MTPLLTATLFGSAAAALGWSMAGTRSRKSTLTGGDAERREELKKREPVVRYAEGWFETLTQFNSGKIRNLEETQRRLDLLFPGLWTPAEFRAAAQLQAVAVGAGVAILGLVIDAFAPAAMFGLVMGAMFPWLKENNLKKLTDKRKSQVRSRLPFVLDLTALMMESGALFNACIQTVVQETGKHPIAEELGRMLSSLRQGLPRAVALKEFAKRIDDNDVDEVVFAVNTSEELGTPLDKTLRSMADRMRQRRVQELERRAETAKVHITWPAMLTMVACLLVVAAPILLPAGN